MRLDNELENWARTKWDATVIFLKRLNALSAFPRDNSVLAVRMGRGNGRFLVMGLLAVTPLRGLFVCHATKLTTAGRVWLHALSPLRYVDKKFSE
jgi:choline dehydrogenase-like flavoprotein